jgi:outer membrane lipoprotein-sorting protein
MDGMALFTSRPATRWLVPAVIALAIIGGGTAIRAVSASAEPSLPDRSAAQLLVDVQTATLNGMSGTVRTTADLGLPQLPIPNDQGSTDLAALVSGSRTLRVWYAGPDKARIALLGTLGESDIIRNGRDVWAWNSRAQTATHSKLSESDSAQARPENLLPRSPQEAAAQALRAIDPSTAVTTGSTARVAGRSAYELILAPRDTASLVGQIRLAIDASEHVPLRVQVFARGGGDPAYEVAFTQVSFTRPDDAQFRFNPPPGTRVEEERSDPPSEAKPEHKAPTGPANEGPTVVGTGWTTVVVAKMPAESRPGGGEGEGAAILNSLPRVSGDWGNGRLLTSKLFSVLLHDDGRVLVGAVGPERLYEVARG